MSPTGVFKDFFLKVSHRDVPSFITASKRSCGKVRFLHLSVILFRGVSVQGCLCPGGLCAGVSVQGGVCPGVGEVFVGGGSLSKGVSVWEVSVKETHPPPPYGNMRVVRILLECILIIFCLMLSQQQKYK